MNNINGRVVYDNATRALYRAFPNIPVGKFKTTQSYLRLEQAVVAGQTLYNFPLLINQGATFNTEQRLNLQDSFVVSQLGFFLALPSGATDATFKLQTYPNDFLFTNPAQYQIFYNSRLTISVNNNVIVPAWDLYRHKVVPQTQQTQALGAGSPEDEISGEEYGFYAVEPNIVLVGSKNYQVQIELPVGPTPVDANSRVVIILRGILAQNSTVVS